MAEDDGRLLFFRADWCGVCHEKGPVVDAIARAAELPLEVVDFESEEGRTRALGARVETVPTLALAANGRIRFRLVGRMITPETAAHLIGMYRPAAPATPGGADDPR
jgi:thiol-disulfide isomerase/thioredoxin